MCVDVTSRSVCVRVCLTVAFAKYLGNQQADLNKTLNNRWIYSEALIFAGFTFLD